MKVAIIGGGINGLYLAWKLADRDVRVDVFEKKNEIGKEVCSGLFSENILKFIPSAEKLIEGEINSTLIHFPKKTVKVNFSEKFLIIEHSKLDKLVAELARNNGVKIFLGKEINENDFSQMEKEYDRIIGSDGAFSLTRNFLKEKEKIKFRLAIQGFVPFKEEKVSSVETWPVKKGFIWKIPKKGRCEYGAIGEPEKIGFLFKQFLKENNISLPEKKSAPVPSGFPCFVKNKKIAICGDAAGLVKPWSGGGVVWGIMAADLLLKNFPNFLKYREEAKKFFLPKFIFSKTFTASVYFTGFNFPRLIPKNNKIKGDFLV
jgi:digeranylgeranylglycerophospholipid reductase